MSDNDRIDRAKRIRRMREGKRVDEDETAAKSEDEADEESGTRDTDDADEPVPSTHATSDGGAAQQLEKPHPEAAEESEEAAESEVAEAAEPSGETGGNSAVSTDSEGTRAPLPDTEALEEALEESEADPEDVETVEPDVAAEEATDEEADATEEAEEETRVLEFELDGEYYCLDIRFIEEIVKQNTITRVPNTPEFVEGVVDLRGQITTILNPKVTIGKENDEAGELIVVFDDEAFEDQGYIGWVVDDVRQVSPITDSEINDPPMAEDYIKGIIDREEDDQFVIWTSPEMAFENAEDE